MRSKSQQLMNMYMSDVTADDIKLASKSSLHTGVELLLGTTIFAYRNRQNQAKPSGKRKTISVFSGVFGSA